jgi:hypothetical protein
MMAFCNYFNFDVSVHFCTEKIQDDKLGIDISLIEQIPGDQEGLFKLVVQLRKFFNSVIYNTATGYVLLVYLTNI